MEVHLKHKISLAARIMEVTDEILECTNHRGPDPKEDLFPAQNIIEWDREFI